MVIPKRGDIVYLDFTPQAGSEQAGRRPAIILSPESFNQKTGYATVCPISQTERKWGFHVPIPEALTVSGVIIADQVKNLDWQIRNAEIKERAPDDLINRVVQIIHTYIFEEYKTQSGGF